MRVLGAILILVLVVLLGAAPVSAVPPDGTMAIGVHVTLVSRWLDPADTEGLITPFMVLYAIHDALVKPMPGGLNTPSLAESWTASPDEAGHRCACDIVFVTAGAPGALELALELADDADLVEREEVA